MTFSVGDKVIWINGQPGSHGYRIDKVFKVHKNGNCRLAGNPQQYGIDGHSTSTGYFGNTIKSWTQEREDKLKAKRATATRRRDFRVIIDKLLIAAAARPNNLSDKILTDLSDVLWKLMDEG